MTWFRPGPRLTPATTKRFDPTQFFDRSEPRNIPNYGRYPGDTIGLKSQAAMSALRPSLYAPVAAGGFYTLGHYVHFGAVDVNGDLLPWDTTLNDRSPLRRIETAAISPDLFDATYYSVEPNYHAYYFANLTASRFPGVAPIADLGNRKTFPDLLKFSVKDQIEVVYPGAADSGGIVRPELYWMIRKPEHLLTGLASEGYARFYVFA